MDNQFSLYWWDADDGQHRELYFVDAKTAVERAHSLAKGPAAMLKIVKKIMITDGGDHCVFLWEDGEIIHPTKEEREEARNRNYEA